MTQPELVQFIMQGHYFDLGFQVDLIIEAGANRSLIA
jgi:hypothetical protein